MTQFNGTMPSADKPMRPNSVPWQEYAVELLAWGVREHHWGCSKGNQVPQEQLFNAALRVVPGLRERCIEDHSRKGKNGWVFQYNANMALVALLRDALSSLPDKPWVTPPAANQTRCIVDFQARPALPARSRMPS